MKSLKAGTLFLGTILGASCGLGASSYSTVPTAPFIDDEQIQYDQYGLAYNDFWNQKASQELTDVLEDLEIPEEFSSRIKFIRGKKIVFILDDSRSMIKESDDKPVNEYLKEISMEEFEETLTETEISELKKKHKKVVFTRWHELKQYVQSAIRIFGALSEDGVDFHFLNRASKLNVKCWKEVAYLFKTLPEKGASTPLAETFVKVANQYKDNHSGVVFSITTDGQPNRPSDYSMKGIEYFASELTKVLKRNEKFYTNIRLCTNNDAVVKDYNTMDTDKVVGKRIDVSDDFSNEYKEVKQYLHYEINRGVYLFKATVGCADESVGKGIYSRFDVWDEEKMKSLNYVEKSTSSVLVSGQYPNVPRPAVYHDIPRDIPPVDDQVSDLREIPSGYTDKQNFKTNSCGCVVL